MKALSKRKRIQLAATTFVVAVVTPATAFAAVTTADVNNVIVKIAQIAGVGGLGYAILQGFNAVFAWREGNGPGMREGMMGIAAGAGVIVLAALLGTQVKF